MQGRTDAVSYLLALAQHSGWKDCVDRESICTEGMRWQCWLVLLSCVRVALSPVLTAIGIVVRLAVRYHTCVSGKATLCLLGTGRNSGGVLPK